MKEHSYYLGEALKSDPKLTELAAKLQANDDDDTVLKDLAQEGGTKLGNILSRVIGKTSYSWDENKTKDQLYNECCFKLYGKSERND